MLTPGSDAVQDTGAGQFYTDYSTSPVLILGKFQFARDRLATHQLTEIEGGQSDKWATQNPFKNSALTPFTTDSGIKVGMLLERLGTYLQPPTVTFSWMRCNSIINSSADYGQGGLYTQWANMQCGLNYSVVILGNFENLASVVTSMTSEGKR